MGVYTYLLKNTKEISGFTVGNFQFAYKDLYNCTKEWERKVERKETNAGKRFENLEFKPTLWVCDFKEGSRVTAWRGGYYFWDTEHLGDLVGFLRGKGKNMYIDRRNKPMGKYIGESKIEILKWVPNPNLEYEEISYSD